MTGMDLGVPSRDEESFTRYCQARREGAAAEEIAQYQKENHELKQQLAEQVAEVKRQADLLALAKEKMDARAAEIERLKRAKLTIREVICGDEVLQILNAHETQNGVRIICE